MIRRLVISLFFMGLLMHCVDHNIERDSSCSADVSWQKEILPLMTTYCSKSGCHDGTSRPNDWREVDQVQSNTTQILQQIKSRNMPFDQAMPNDKIELIECWILRGAKSN